MDYQTRVNIVRNYELPEEIKDFCDKHPLVRKKGYYGWYSDHGTLKIK